MTTAPPSPVSVRRRTGVLGTRGDVRIGGHLIDGNSNVLAYNFFPNHGEMIIDTGDSFYSGTTNNSRGLRNTTAARSRPWDRLESRGIK